MKRIWPIFIIGILTLLYVYYLAVCFSPYTNKASMKGHEDVYYTQKGPTL